MFKKESTALKTASVLAFERKLDVSDGLLHSNTWNATSDWKPVTLMEKSVRGTISNRLKAKDEADSLKLDAKVESPNLQTVDVANLPAEHDTMRLSFTLKVLGNAGVPSACNSQAYQNRLAEVIEGYKTQFGFSLLAHRYAINLANGRYLWRNRLGTEEVRVVVRQLANGETKNSWSFNALEHSLRNFDQRSKELESLAAVIQSGLLGKEYVLLHVACSARIGAGQEVYPSQELILDKDSKKSKVLYAVSGVAGLHSQKISNALRTIDDWIPEAAQIGPIAIETYGAVTSRGKAYRQPRKSDFYSLLDNWLIKNEVPSENDQHFVMAVLIRGGVFGEAE